MNIPVVKRAVQTKERETKSFGTERVYSREESNDVSFVPPPSLMNLIIALANLFKKILSKGFVKSFFFARRKRAIKTHYSIKRIYKGKLTRV